MKWVGIAVLSLALLLQMIKPLFRYVKVYVGKKKAETLMIHILYHIAIVRILVRK